MITAAAVSRLDGLVRAAIDEGASVVVGGGPLDRQSYFSSPTVLSGVKAGAEIADQEIFGPVAPLITFADVDEMFEIANGTEMGLAGYVFTGDVDRGLAVAELLEAGMVGVNRGSVSDPAAPFGGMKQSGLGREGGAEGIYEFCGETQYISARW